MERARTSDRFLAAKLLILAMILSLMPGPASAQLKCGANPSPGVWEVLQRTTPGFDLQVVGPCLVEPGGATYRFGNVNILKGGQLYFREHDRNNQFIEKTQTDFWARSIIIENGGLMHASAGINTSHVGPVPYGMREPYGAYGGTLTIHLYGEDESKWVDQKFSLQNKGAPCQTTISTTVGPCGVPLVDPSNNNVDVWNNKQTSELNLPGGVRDFFYQYGTLYGDGRCTPNNQADKDKNWIFENGKCIDENDGTRKAQAATPGYFGSKVLGVAYGGTLELFGHKGSCHEIDFVAQNFPCVGLRDDNDPLRTRPGWTRLSKDLKAGDTVLNLEHPLRTGGYGKDAVKNNIYKWGEGDQIVVTTTDYLPGHSELLTIDNAAGALVTVKSKVQWPHNGTRYALKDRVKPAAGRVSLDPDLLESGAETRAAVALLTRSIQIVSAGNVDGADFGYRGPGNTNPDPKYSFGANMVIRQGFERVQIQGVEFKQMGQGGRLAHYPVHFHMARKTPGDTFVKDSSVNESMTRWIVLHSTHGVTLARNIGYKSIGHGFYLEDGTEIDNKFHSNIGIFARAAVDNDTHNPRQIPGILAANQKKVDAVAIPYLTDSNFPTVFWITNGWNDFIGNMAAGASGCGVAYWFIPSLNGDHVEVSDVPHAHMKWSGYAALQQTLGGATPLKSFYKNSATSTMLSFQTTGDAAPCYGIVKPDAPSSLNVLKAVESNAPDPKAEADEDYYPRIVKSGNRHATRCKVLNDGTYDCEGIQVCDSGKLENCEVTVLDHFTSSFHWAEIDYAAIWLRNQWYLVTNSVISDVQSAGLTFVSGGDYTHSSAIKGYWTLARNSVFIGHSQPNDYDHRYSQDGGPFNKDSGLQCGWQKLNPVQVSNYCLNREEGISIPLSNFSIAQRLLNIYDGPSYQDSNVFLDISKTTCPNTGSSVDGRCIYGTGITGIRRDLDGTCYLPNAAIAWKQPNGFFYPPAFHSTNLFFDRVDIRHYVIAPQFQAPAGAVDFGQGGTYKTSTSGKFAVDSVYCSSTPTMFDNFSAIDRQTVLNDDDGSLTGLQALQTDTQRKSGTLSINEDLFFSAPVETAECLSNLQVTASKACDKDLKPPVTARTSPYDYVVTAIAPGCSQNPAPSPPLGYGRCGDNARTGAGGLRWSSDCANPECYGVPLYRQFLTGEEQKRWAGPDFKCDDNKSAASCRWPFIRMAGQNMYQRHTLTLNNAEYFVDTSIKLDTQRSEPFTVNTGDARNVNVFEPGEKYFMFFLYAQPTTKQTYKIYVGNGFDTRTIVPVRGNIEDAPVKFTNDDDSKSDKDPWFKVIGYDNRVVTVLVDFSLMTKEKQKELSPLTHANGQCGPRKFCKWASETSDQCVSNLEESGPKKDPRLIANWGLKAEVDAVCKNWAVKDLDCPQKGCFGFSFTLNKGRGEQDSFVADDKGIAFRPKVNTFASWTTKFTGTSKAPESSKGQCYYDPEKPPIKESCPAAR
jgi:hypothetical protein